MAKSIHPDMLAVVCGSYRRGKQTCGDVDVLISHPDGKSHKGVLSKILEGLRQKGECIKGFYFSYPEIASICSMPDKSLQLTQNFLDDFAAMEENLQHKWSSVTFFTIPSLKIYKFILSSFQ